MTLCCPNHTFDTLVDLDELSYIYLLDELSYIYLPGCSNRIWVFISNLALYMMRTFFVLIPQPCIFLLS